MRSNRRNRFEDRFFLITGGSSGIGLALSAELLSSRARVLIVGLQPQAVQEALSCLGGGGPRLAGLVCDVGASERVEAMAATVLAEHGVPDVIVNSAGFATYRAFEQSDAAEIEDLMNVNFGGAIRVTKAFVSHMIRRGSGQIVNIASIAGALKMTPNAVYCASKHGMLAWSQCLDLELRRFGLSVTVVCPGRVQTPFFDHETFRRRRHRKESELTVEMPRVVEAVLDCIARPRPLRFVPRYLGTLAWLTRALGPLVQYPLDRLMRSRIEDLYSGTGDPPARNATRP